MVQEAAHLEWVDDVQLFMRKGAASPVAYHMAAPLLADIANTLQVSNTLHHVAVLLRCCWLTLQTLCNCLVLFMVVQLFSCHSRSACKDSQCKDLPDARRLPLGTHHCGSTAVVFVSREQL